MQNQFEGSDFGQFKVLAFDLDGTLAESKQPMSARIGGLLCKLSHFHQIAIISGADWPQFQKQVVPVIEKRAGFFTMYPTCGSKKYRWEEVAGAGPDWYEVSGGAYDFRSAEVEAIIEAIERATEDWAYRPREKIYGPQIENRGTQITFSALGQQAPPEVKTGWDARFEKRRALKTLIEYRLQANYGAAELPYEIKMGGATSIDITMKGIDKAFAIRRIADHKWFGGLREEDILFIGDAMEEGGNDWAATKTNCRWLRTSGVEETERILERILVAT